MKKFNIYNVTVLAISGQNKKAKEDQNQVVNSRPFYIINEYTQTLEFKYRNFARLPDKL